MVDGFGTKFKWICFASVQTLNNRLKEIKLSPEYYDFIVDEVHHILGIL
jgi:superfamily II DNA or RNA helicase